MICERCKKIIATIHLTEIIRDNRSEVHLCEMCAKEIGLNTKLSNFSLSATDMLSFLDLNEVTDIDDKNSLNMQLEKVSSTDKGLNKCKKCGFSFIDFKRTGKLGCGDCFIFLDESLISVISAYHGENKHIGKIPDNFHDVSDKSSDNLTSDKEKETFEYNESILSLKEKLEIAIAEEKYEDAAMIRDLINSKKLTNLDMKYL